MPLIIISVHMLMAKLKQYFFGDSTFTIECVTYSRARALWQPSHQSTPHNDRLTTGKQHSTSPSDPTVSSNHTKAWRLLLVYCCHVYPRRMENSPTRMAVCRMRPKSDMARHLLSGQDICIARCTQKQTISDYIYGNKLVNLFLSKPPCKPMRTLFCNPTPRPYKEGQRAHIQAHTLTGTSGATVQGPLKLQGLQI